MVSIAAMPVTSAERLADHRRALEAVQLQERLVDEHVAAAGVEVDDRVRNVVGEEAQLLLARRERLLGDLEVVDVVFGAVESADPSRRVEVGRDAAVHPARRVVGRAVDPLVLDVLAALRALEDGAQEFRDVGLQDFERRPAVDLVLRAAHPVRERLVDERVRRRRVEVGDRAGDVVGDEAQLDFLRSQRIADRDVVVDIRHHGEEAADVSAHRAVREERDAHPAQLAGRLAFAPLERDLRAVERARDVFVHFGERAAGDQLLDVAPEEIVGCDADPGAERLVREADLELPVEVDDRRADAVGDEAQPVLAPAGLELQALQLVDVGVGDEEAANVAVGAAIGVVVDANPHRRPARDDELPLEPRSLAAQRRFDVGLVQRIGVAADDVLDLLADDLGEGAARPFDVRLVGETIAAAAVDIGDRQPERVQLALRKRGKAVRSGAVAHLAGDGRHPEAGELLR